MSLPTLTQHFPNIQTHLSQYILLLLLLFSTLLHLGHCEQFTVFENEEPGTLVGSVAEDGAGKKYHLGTESELFILYSDSGIIETKVKLDRENLTKTTINLFVVTTEINNPMKTRDVQIKVKDKNDNAPIFNPSSFNLSISENIKLPKYYSLPVATDKDEGINSVSSNYQIVSGNENGQFRLQVVTEESLTQLILHVEKLLDRETRNSFTLNISAEDGGSPVHYGYLTVNIHIIDYNDNGPVFIPSKYDVELNESASNGTFVVKVLAEDSDIDSNGAITYSFTNTKSNTYKEFIIDEHTGVVLLTGPFTCHTSPEDSCLVIVQASDQGNPRLVANAFVTVHVIRGNNHKPSIVTTLISQENGFAIVEKNTEIPKTFIAVLTVTDEDSGTNGNVTLSMISGNIGGHFNLKTLSPDIVGLLVVRPFTDESPNAFTLIFEARDQGKPFKFSRETIRVKVIKPNRYPPIFIQANQSQELVENSFIGSFVANMGATDQDNGINSKLLYQILSGDPNHFFAIDENTGLVTVAKNLDYEVKSAYFLTIRVLDRGPSPLSSTCWLRINIIDTNDNSPQFKPSNQFSIDIVRSDNEMNLLDLNLIDKDVGSNGMIDLSLLDSTFGTNLTLFILKNRSLLATSKLSHATKKQYILKVIATDRGVQKKTSTATVFVNIQDTSQNTFRIYPNDIYIHRSSNQQNLPYITKIKTLGAQPLHFNFNKETSGFYINSKTGTVYSIFWGENKYILSVTVRSISNQTVLQPASVVLYPNGTVPTFMKSKYEFTFPEDNLSSGFISKQVGAVSGTGINKFYLTTGDPGNYFRVDESSGEIYSAKSLNREVLNKFVLDIVGVGDSNFATCSAEITITDRNDNRPMFDATVKLIQLPDTIPTGFIFDFETATDNDANSNVTYALSGSNSSIFKVDSSSGGLSLTQNSWSWATTSAEVMLTAHNSHSQVMKLSFELIDTNNHSPVLDQTVYKFTVLESVGVNTIIGKISATDADLSPVNNQVKFLFMTAKSPTSKLGIFPDGRIYVTEKFNREEKQYYVVEVIATDNGFPQRSSSATVSVAVLDINNKRPQFSLESYTFTLNENVPARTVVGYVSANDEDFGLNGLVFYRILNEADCNFTIGATTGVLMSKRSFNYETTTPVQVVTVEAFDSGATVQTSTVEVSVVIVDINENIPKFKKNFYAASIKENATFMSTIIFIQATDEDIGRNGLIKYSILSGNDNKTFAIDTISGRVYVNGLFDRETISVYNLVIMATDSPIEGKVLSSTTSLSITIEDVNDFSPWFVNLNTNSIKIKESARPGTLLYQFKAVDRDSGSNGLVIFSITSGDQNNDFGLDPIQGKLYIRKYLDYEVQKRYLLTIKVEDSGSSSLSISINFTVILINENDNAPKFDSLDPVLYVSENALVGSVVGQVTASDKDKDDITYHLGTVGAPFQINASTGKLTLTKSLDRESVEAYKLMVAAEDNGSPRLTSTTSVVSIIVVDVNDNRPLVRTQMGILLPRTLLVNSEVATLSASDPDIGTNAQLTYSLIPTEDAQYFSLDSTVGTLNLKTVISPLKLLFSLKFTVSNGNDMRTDVQSVQLIIQSSDTNSPQFQKSLYSVQVRENGPPHQELLQLTAAYPGNPIVHFEYFITGVYAGNRSQPQPRGLFSLDKTSGYLYVGERPLDREATATGQYELEIAVMDANSSRPRTQSTTVFVSIVDVNDSPPKFTTSQLTITVKENLAQIPTPLTTIEAKDSDLDANLTFSLVDTVNGIFSIEATTGRLSATRPLDHEIASRYRLTIVVSDSIHEATQSVIIQVTDSNDNGPVFVNTSDSSWTMVRGAPVGSLVGLVLATDADTGENGRVEYRLVNDWIVDGKFLIDVNTGLVTTGKRLDSGQGKNHYLLVVTATDQGSPALTATTTVLVNLIDSNAHAPVFQLANYRASIREDTSIGTSIVTVQANDMDSDSSLRYSLAQDDLPLSINPITGEVTLERPLDRELVSSYTFQAVVTDGSHITRTEIDLQVADVNDSPPVFIDSQAVLSEDQLANTVFHTVHCTDPDLNTTMAYSLPSSNANIFFINSITGALQANQKVDRELNSSFPLAVVCSDGIHSTQKTLSITMEDVNDNPPLFSRSEYSATVSKSSSTSLLQLSATDLDSGANSQLRFYLHDNISSGVADLVLDPISGILSPSWGRIDTLSRDTYILRALVTDLGRPRLTSEIEIKLNVDSGVYRCPPSFLDTPLVFWLTGDANIARTTVQQLGYLVAKSCDNQHNSRLQYFLKTGQSQFSLDRDTGLLLARAGVGTSLPSGASFKVKAVDQNGQTGETEFTIQRLSNRPVPPVCQPTVQSITLVEDAPANTLVTRVVVLVTDNTSPVRFTLIGQDEGDLTGSIFAVNSSTGEVRTTAVGLDRETRDFHWLSVEVRYSPNPAQRVVCGLQIFVTDVNDNAPGSLAIDKQFFGVFKQSDPVGSFIGAVSAWDPDLHSNGTVRYFLNPSTDSGYFRVDPVTGFISLLSTPPGNHSPIFSLTLQATDNKRPTTLHMTITRSALSSSNLYPTLSYSSGPITIPMDTTVGQTIKSFTATPGSSGGHLIYELAGISPNSGASFYCQEMAFYDTDLAVNMRTGALYIARSLNESGVTQYEVVIRVRSPNDQTVFAVTSILQVNIGPASNPAFRPAPNFTQFYYRFHTAENQDQVVHIGTIGITGPDQQLSPAFSIVSGNEDGLFSLSSSSGKLRTIKKLDHEVKDLHELEVTVAFVGGSSVARCRIYVKVDDQNDHYPRFNQAFFARISEGSPLGSVVLRALATDADKGDRLVYRLTDNPGGKFHLDPDTAVLTVAKPLDYEEKSRYDLKVKVSDGSKEPETGIGIDLIDENDNAPVFVEPKVNIILMRSELITSHNNLIGLFKATDSDATGSDNARVTYRLGGLASAAFSLDSMTGELMVRDPLALQIDQVYYLTLTARDSGTPTLSSNIKVTVRILGDVAPIVLAPISTFVAVSPHIGAGEQLIQLHARSPLPNARLFYTLVSGNGSSLFTVNLTSGAITTTDSLSSSPLQTVYKLNIKIESDGGTLETRFLRLAAPNMLNLSLVVTPNNPTAPRFTDSTVDYYIRNNAENDSKLFNISVIDNDPGLNGLVTLSLSPSTQSKLFAIKSDGLYLTSSLKGIFTRRQHQLTIVATDAGIPKKSSQKTVIIHLVPSNEVNAILFTELIYSVELKSNASINSIVVEPRLAASISSAAFSLSGNQPVQDMFIVDASDGRVRLAHSLLNNQIYNIIQFKVGVKDLRSNRTGETLVIVRVKYINMFASTCGRPTGYEFTVNPEVFSGSRNYIGKVEALDQDSGSAGKVQYSIYQSDPPGQTSFHVDKDSGELTVLGPLTQGTRSRVILSVLITNPGAVNIDLIGRCSVTIKIKDGNDPPRFDKQLYSTEISEITQINHVVLRVFAQDFDIKELDRSFVYRIASPENSPFEIDESSGEIRVTRILNRKESLAGYQLQVVAVDRGTPPMTGTTSVVIKLWNANKQSPVFHPVPVPSVHIQEGLGSGALVDNLAPLTSDFDGPGNGPPFHYSLLSSIHSKWFELKSNGMLYTRTSLDREATSSVSLPILVSDSGIPPQTSTLTLNVVIDDVNDSPSSPRALSIQVTQYDSVGVWGPVAELRPIDADSTGDYHCQTVSTLSGTLLAPDCWLFVMGQTSTLQQSLRIRHHDGRHAAVESTVTVQISDIPLKQAESGFIEVSFLADTTTASILINLQKLLSAIQALTREKVVLASFTNGPPGLLITSPTWSKATAATLIANNLALLSDKSGLKINNVRTSLCDPSPCNLEGTERCNTLTSIHNDRPVRRHFTNSFNVAYPPVEWKAQCICRTGFTGSLCQQKTTGCPKKMCRNSGTCFISTDGQPACLCPATYTGDICQDDVKECGNNPCLHGTCSNTIGGYTCTCHSDWTGTQCNRPINICQSSSSSCNNNGVCLPQLGSKFQCLCRFGYYGTRCETAAWGVPEGAYLVYDQGAVFPAEYKLRFEVSTAQTEALLVYQPLANGLRMVLQLVKGQPILALNSGKNSTQHPPITFSSSITLSISQWFRLELALTKTEVSLSIIKCPQDELYCPSVCLPPNCSQGTLKIPAAYKNAFTGTSKVYLGGVPTLLSPPGLSSFDLTGCLRRVTATNLPPVAPVGITVDSCPRPLAAPCANRSAVCGLGQCIDEWSQPRCVCPEGYQPPNCTRGYTGFTFTGSSIVQLSARPGYSRMLASQQPTGSRQRRDVAFSVTSLVSLRLRTSTTNGVIFIAKSDATSYTALSLEEGYLVVTDSLTAYSSAPQAVRHASVQLNDARVHNVSLLRSKDGYLTLVVDATSTQVQWLESHNPLGPTVLSYFVGGMPENLSPRLANLGGFSGCLSELSFNNIVQPLSGVTANYRVTVFSGSPLTNCPSEACAVTSCQQGFKCHERVDEVGVIWGATVCRPTGMLTSEQLILAICLPILTIIIGIIIIVTLVILIRRHRRRSKRRPKPAGPLVLGPHHRSISINGRNLKEFNHPAYLGPGSSGPRSLANHSTNSTNTTCSGLLQENGVLTEHHFISKHIERELSACRRQPDLLPPADSIMVLGGGGSDSIYNHQDDRLFCIGGMLPMGHGDEDPYELGPAEHYDLDRASSMAPSDVLEMSRLGPGVRGGWPGSRVMMLDTRPGSGPSPNGSAISSLHSSASRIYERLGGSQASTTNSQEGPRYPYAYRHRLQPRVTYDPTRRPQHLPPPPTSQPPLSPPHSVHSSSGAASLDSFTGSDPDIEPPPSGSSHHLLRGVLPPPLPSGTVLWRQPEYESMEPLLGWGPRLDKLVGVFQDIACLPNGEIQEEYV